MWIMNQSRSALYSTENDQRFTVTRKEDAVLIHYGNHCIGRYFTYTEAQDALDDLFCALSRDEYSFQMPISLLQAAQENKRDARTKRKGGS